jgi:chaperonin cofactor prefoldin
MSNTPIQISTELSKALEQINQSLYKIDDRLNKLEIGQARLEERLIGMTAQFTGELKAVDERLSGQIKALDEKVSGLSKRVDSVDFINRGVFVALIITILGGFAKIFGLINNP